MTTIRNAKETQRESNSGSRYRLLLASNVLPRKSQGFCSSIMERIRFGNLLTALAALVLLGGTAASSNAAVWYVDNTLTSGSNNGTSWANAWRSLRSVVWGSSGVKAGDTLYLSGGSTSKVYTDTWEIGASGTATAPITITVDASNPAHSGRVTFDYNSLGDNATTGGIGVQRNYIVFNGNVNGEPRIVINNLRNVSNGTSTAGIFAQGTTGVVIDSIASTNCNNAIWIQNSTGFVIRNCIIRGARGDAAIRAAGSSGNFDASRIYNNKIQTVVGSSGGPDGIQGTSGLSIYNNEFSVAPTTVKTSSQHPDMLQLTGDYLKIYGNDFVNVGDSSIDYDAWANPTPNNIWIFNNTFRITNSSELDPYPEYIRFYSSGSGVKSITNFKIFNNTFVDNDYWTSIGFYGFGNPTGSGNEIKNNIFYNCGSGSSRPVVRINNSSAFNSSSWTLNGNVYYHPANSAYIVVRDVLYSVVSWITGQEPNSTSSTVRFASYSRYSPNNDLHLASNDTTALDKGLTLSYISTDKDGNSRPQGGAWDIGAYERPSATSGNRAPVVTAPTSTAVDVDSSTAGIQVYTGTAVTLSASASDADGDSLTWQWLYSLNGSAAVTQRSGSGTSASTTYSLADEGTYVWTARFSDGQTTAQAQLTITAVAPPAPAPDPGIAVPLEVESGTITAPFVVSGGSISQSTLTSLAAGGRVVITFTVPQTGEYGIVARVDAPSDGENSFFLNIDAEPQDPAMIWHVTPTLGKEDRLVAWQGSGTWDNSEFSPKYFNLSAGTHKLYIRGREANVSLDSVTIRPRPETPQGLVAEIP